MDLKSNTGCPKDKCPHVVGSSWNKGAFIFGDPVSILYSLRETLERGKRSVLDRFGVLLVRKLSYT